MQAFSAWIHICAIRLFVESILRYGLPPKFLAALMKPNQKSTARLRKVLASLFGNSGIARTPDNLKHLSTHPSARCWEACAHCLCRPWGWALLEYAETVTMHPLKLALVMRLDCAGTSQYFDGDDKGMAGLAGDSEMYPYVSFTISVDG